MRTLVIGGAASGKSAWAEGLLAAPCEGAPRYYIAAMQPYGAEAEARIERHRIMRAGRGFATIERYTDLAGLVLPEPGDVLMECMTNWVANELFAPDRTPSAASVEAAILDGVQSIERQARRLVVVTGDLFSDGVAYDGPVTEYLKCLASVNRALAARFERVAEILCGCPAWIKGGSQ